MSFKHKEGFTQVNERASQKIFSMLDEYTLYKLHIQKLTKADYDKNLASLLFHQFKSAQCRKGWVENVGKQ